MHERLCKILLWILIAGWAVYVKAQPQEFRKAEAAFQFQDYRNAARLFERLLYPKPRIRKKELLIKAHEELGACYFWLKNPKRMEEEFTAVLVLDPKHKLDPFYYPPPLIERFERLKKRLILLGILQITKPKKQSQKGKKKKSLCTQVRITEYKRSVIPCLVPFGVGQFYNKQKGKGIAFAVTQGLALGVNIGAFWGIVGLARSDGTYSPYNARIARGLRYLQYGALGVFAVSAVWGIVDAIVNFKPGEVKRKEIKVPCRR